MTYTISINSGYRDFLVLLISFNFGEIKGVIFKGFDKKKLLMVSKFDINERMMLYLYTILASIVTMNAVNWEFSKFKKPLLLCSVWIIPVEMLTDWTKHLYILHKSFFSTTIYHEYTAMIHRMAKSKQPVHNIEMNPILKSMGYFEFSPVPVAAYIFYIFYTVFTKKQGHPLIIGIPAFYLL
ncbi:MAG: Transmembrane anterior posterior transformation protein 1 [Paramarteilia canceri]